MGRLREWLSRMYGALRPGRQDRDLEEELKLHLELAVEDARRRGHTDDAVRAARMKVGATPQAMDALRDQRGWPLVAGLRQDLRLAMRSMAATPVVTAVAIVSLALAIGANTAIFSIVNALLLRTLPVADPARLVHVSDSVVTDTGETRLRSWSYPFFEQLRQRPELFDAATAWSSTRFNLASGGETQFINGASVDGGFFQALGVPAVLGRTLTALDDQPGGGPDGPVAVIGYGYWQRQYGGAADVIGRSIRLNNQPFTIIGVTPPDFFGVEVGTAFDVVVPFAIRGGSSPLNDAAINFLRVMARLRPNQSIETAAAELRGAQTAIRDATMGPWEKDEADRYLTSPFTVVAAPTGFSGLRSSYTRPLYFLLVLVALVLLIGCINVANLLRARAIGRRHELSVRVAIGASRWRLVRQHLAESLLLAAASAVLGLGTAAFAGPFLVQQLNTVVLDVSLDARVLLFTVIVTAVTALLFGTAPALWATRVHPFEALNGRGPSAGRSFNGVMGSLVSIQVAFSVVLIVAAGLFIRSFSSLVTRDLGLNVDPVMVVQIDTEAAAVEPSERMALYDQARAAVLQLPDVAAASISRLAPLGSGGWTPAIEVASAAGPINVAANGDVYGNLISPGWFDTFGTRLVGGRDFTDGDRTGAPTVGVVNERFVRRFFDDGRAIGRIVTVYPNTPRAIRMEIVGVVADAIYHTPRHAVPPTWYLPIAQFSLPGFSLTSVRLSVRARTGAPQRLNKSVTAAIGGVHPGFALTFRPLADQVRTALTRERLLAQLAGFFGVLGLVLAGLGLYGVTTYAASRRRAEIGIRLALGASASSVIRMVLVRVAVLVAAGIVAGGGVSLWASRFVGGLIYGLPAQDAPTIIVGSLVPAAIAAVAAWLPARRAARLNPLVALREH